MLCRIYGKDWPGFNRGFKDDRGFKENRGYKDDLIFLNQSSYLEGNFGGTLIISLSEFLQNEIGMVGAYWLGFKRGWRNAILIILAFWKIIPPIWRIILEELSPYLFLSSSKIKLEWLGLIGWGLIGDLEMIFDLFGSF